MRRYLTTTCLLILGAGLGAGAFWLGVRARLAAPPPDTPTEEQARGADWAQTPRLSRTPEGETVVHFETEIQKRVGLMTEPLTATTWQPETLAYGSLEEDAAQSFTLRAPVAGLLRTGEAASWPVLNQRLEAGARIGYVEPRLTQTERIDLAARRTQAHADAAEAEAALATARSSYENKKKLNAENKAVSDRALEEAQAKVKSEEARLHAAQQIVELIEAAQSGAGAAATRFELETEQAGEVVEALARPGEAVEAGQVLLRIVRFDTLVARVEIPVGEHFNEDAATARIVVVGDEDHPFVGERIGLAAGANSGLHGSTLLLRVPTAGRSVRPGAAVVAHVPAAGGARTGVAVPRGAVIRLLGKVWVYVQTAEEEFTRRELSDAESAGDAWFAPRGFQPGDRVATAGAQVLLSEELRAQIEREETAQK